MLEGVPIGTSFRRGFNRAGQSLDIRQDEFHSRVLQVGVERWVNDLCRKNVSLLKLDRLFEIARRRTSVEVLCATERQINKRPTTDTNRK